MAIAAYANDSPLSRRKWSKKSVREMTNTVHFLRWGMFAKAKKVNGNPLKDTGLPIVQFDDLSEGDDGANLRIPWVNRLRGAGKSGNDQLEGNEEQIKFGRLDVIIDRLRHATGYDGIMSAVRNGELSPDLAKDLLLEWLIDKREDGLWEALFKGAAQHLINAGHYVASAHPNTFHYDKTTDELPVGALQQGVHQFDTNVLDRIIEWFDDSDNPIPRCEIEGEQLGVVVIHTKQATTLRRDPRFHEMLVHGYKRTDGTGHPMLQNSKYRYGDLLIYVCNRNFHGVRAGLDGNGYTQQHIGAVALGPRAIGCANGGFPNGQTGTGKAGLGYDEMGNIAVKFEPSDDTDYGNKVKWGIDAIWGDKRADFVQEAGGDDKNHSSGIFWTIQ